MKIHLPLMLRFALLAACSYVFSTSVDARDAYWTDFAGNRYDIPREAWSVELDHAETIILHDCVRDDEVGDGYYNSYLYGGALYYWDASYLDGYGGSERKIISARLVSIEGNGVEVNHNADGGSARAEGGALVINYVCSYNTDRQLVDSFSFSGSGEVSIKNNYAYARKGAGYAMPDPIDDLFLHVTGGAIYMMGAYRHEIGESCISGYSLYGECLSVLEFKDNDHVYIRGNYESDGETSVLNSIVGEDIDLVFAARAGKVIESYDGIDIDGTLWVNATRPELSNGAESYTGTVILSGEYAEKDLYRIKGTAPSAEELEQSRLVMTEAVYVQSGTLVLKDMYLSALQDIDFSGVEHEYLFYSSAEAEVQMENATLTTDWYAPVPGDRWTGEEGPDQFATVHLPRATFTGHNVINANYIKAVSGEWVFNVGVENKSQAVVSIVFDGEHAYDEVVNLSEHGLYTEGTCFRINVTESLSNGKYKLLEFDSSLGEWVGREAVTLLGEVSGSIAGSSEQGIVYFTIDSSDMLTLWYNYAGGVLAPDEPQEPEQRPQATLTWKSDAYGVWAEGEGAGVWGGTGSDLSFHTGDRVVFADGATVYVRGAVLPSDVLVRNESAQVYISQDIDGGQIAGGTSLTKEGAGELLLDLANTYTGGTFIKGGLVTIWDAMALGLGAVEMSGGILNMNALSMSNDLRISGEVSIWSGSAFKGNAEISDAVLRESDLSIAAELSMKNTTLENSSLTLRSGSHTVVDELVLNSMCTLTVEGASLSGNITLTGGKLIIAAPQSISGDLCLAGGLLELDEFLEVTGGLSTEQGTRVKLDVDKLQKQRKIEILRAGDLSGVDVEQLTLFQLVGARAVTTEKKDNALWVELHSADLTWNSGSSSVWGLQEEGDEWDADAEDCHFYDYDNVTFNDAGEVKIAGVVTPGAINVQGDGDTIFSGSGSIAGVGVLTKSGAGVLEIHTDNSQYSGEIKVYEGELSVGHENALGSGSAAEIHNAVFNGNGLNIRDREISLNGDRVRVVNADGVEKLRIESGAVVSGAYNLGMGHTLTVGVGGAEFAGDFTFEGGGRLVLSGEAFVLTGHTRIESSSYSYPYYTASSYGDYMGSFGGLSGLQSWYESIKNIIENGWDAAGLNVTVIDLSGQESSLKFGGDYKLLEFDDPAFDGESIADHFVVYMNDWSKMLGQELEYVDGSLWLHIKVSELPESIVDSLTNNQKVVYSAMYLMQNLNETDGVLDEMRQMIFRDAISAEDPQAAVKSLLDQLSGAELTATMMSQIEGNLAHLRRLRANMGNGQRVDDEGKNAFYVLGYETMNQVDAKSDGPGMRRTERGGTLGYERVTNEKSLFGLALTGGSTTIKPTMGSNFDEDDVRFDLYGLSSFGNGWQNLMSVGLGRHAYNTRRSLPGGYVASASMDGYSVNFQDEVAYTWQIKEKHSVQPFISLEATADVINSFTESGAGSASLESTDCATSAVDITLGARYIRSFQMKGREGNFSVQAALVVRKGDSSTKYDMHFVGAPHRRFIVSSAGHRGVGYDLSAGLLLPVSAHASVTASANAVLRSGAKETGASIGLRLTF